jgi:CheY-like chemotaxis protein
MSGVPAQRGEILLVEDDPDLAMALVALLSRHGLPVTAVPAAEPALDLLARRRFSGLLCDYDLPGRDGLWLLGECRRRWPGVRRVLTSGKDARDFEPALRAGLAHVFLAKPAAAAALLCALRGELPSAAATAPPPRCRLCGGSGRLTLRMAGEARRRPSLCVACRGRGTRPRR